jgi:LuxR family maltose regulon positive regulatory protein
MAELLVRIESADETIRVKEFTLKLLSAFDTDKELHPGDSTSTEKNRLEVNSQPLIERLSESELEVLKLLRTDLSGPEIARERMVSLSTIRTHTQRIFAKLGVNNSRAAVRRAEEIDLF